ncbi:phage terminase small subunit [Xenorhabdus sp. PB30.3]|uniref:phage terminase small subunit n=1 Tax=Xenorhabdus sp. PB30.3 TaxID=2788941 RepID=UPI001E2BDE0E|nr:phage terminase small subunit [Xenorhabdus sp. PB30.3]MCC8379558.1 terminase [Xenorhabdus sp. PB30.3]
MLTPAQEHWQRTMAARRGDEQMSSATLTAYEQILHRLRIDQTRLSGLQGTERKIAYKGEVIAAYDSWIDGVLKADTGQADEVLTHIMIWQIDIGHYERALTLAEYVIRHNLPLPDRYHRTVGPLLVDEICDKALTIFAAGNEAIAPISLTILEWLFVLVEPLDMPNQVRAKLLKTLAYTLRKSSQQADKERALSLMQQALLLFANIGVKKDIETLTRELKKAEDNTAPPKPGATDKKPPKTKTTAAKKIASR